MNRTLLILLIFISLLSCGRKKASEQEVLPLLKESQRQNKSAPAMKNEAKTTENDGERTEWQNPDLILDLIGDLDNKVVADIGAGSGYFTFKIARKASKVIALDIDPKALEYIESQKEIVGEWSSNIEARLTPPDVPNLLDDEVDIVLIVNTYNYIPNKDIYFPRLLRGMKSGARLVIVDFKKGDIPVGPADESKVEPRSIRTFLRKSSFRRININEESLQYQFIITAEKK